MRTLTTICVIALVSCAVLAQSQPATSWHVLDPASMDKSVDPCVDFYAYSCGGWMKSNPIPADQAAWSVYSKLQEQNRANVRLILEAAAVPGNKRSVIDQKIGDYYASCMDEEAIETAGLEPLRANLKRIDNIASMDDMADYLARFHPQDLSIYFGQSALFSLSAEQDAKNSSETIAVVDQGGLGLPDRDYYLKPDTRSEQMRKDYAAHVQKMFELNGDTPERAVANAQVVLRIETALAKGSMTSVARRDPAAVYHRMKRTDLAALAPSFPWDRYFAGLGLSQVASLNVAAPEFFKAMEALLKIEEVPAWKTYLRWHQLHAQARWLPDAFVQEDFDFYGRKLTGARELQPRWKRCVRFEDRALGEAVGQAYVVRYFSGDAKQRALKMVQSIEAAMDRDIRELPWMSALRNNRPAPSSRPWSTKSAIPTNGATTPASPLFAEMPSATANAPTASSSAASSPRSASLWCVASGTLLHPRSTPTTTRR
jgi:putative endopeptidase